MDINTQELKEIVEIALDRELEDFAMDANFYEVYEMDSLGAVALVVEVQKRYDVRIPDDSMPDICLLYTSPSPRDVEESRMPSSA